MTKMSQTPIHSTAGTAAAKEKGFETAVVVDAVRAVDVHAGDGEQALEEMRSAGISLQTLAETAAEDTR
jgi:nicotinamidase-related amidase